MAITQLDTAIKEQSIYDPSDGEAYTLLEQVILILNKVNEMVTVVNGADLTAARAELDRAAAMMDEIITYQSDAEVLQARAAYASLNARLNAIETTASNNKAALELSILDVDTKPKICMSQVAYRQGTKSTGGVSSDYIIFKDIYHCYDVGAKTTAIIYGLEEHYVNSTSQKIYKSLNGGVTWSLVGSLTIDQANGIWYEHIFVEPFFETYFLVKTLNGYNSPANRDVVSFSNTLAQLGTLNIGDASWLSSNQTIDACPNSNYSARVVIFGEYAMDSKGTVKLWRTTDKGVTWTAVLSYTGNNGVSASGEIRHFHTVAVDPYTKHWWVGTGDSDPQCRIWRSTDDGQTWVQLFSGSQRERTCGFVFTETDVYYGMDSSAETTNHSKIVKISKSDLSRVDVATVDMGYSVFQLTRCYYPDGFFIWSTHEPNSYDSGRVLIQFYSFEDNKIHVVGKEITTGKEAGYTGFRSASRYQDKDNGHFYVQPWSSTQQEKFGASEVSRYRKVLVTK